MRINKIILILGTKKSKNYNKPKSENSSQPGYPDVMVEFGQENENLFTMPFPI